MIAVLAIAISVILVMRPSWVRDIWGLRDFYNSAPSEPVSSAASIDLPAYTSPPRSEVSEDEAKVAQAINASTPANPEAIMLARPFVFAATPVDRARAEQCLAAAVYYEAASEPLSGQRAVAQVVLNRVRHPIYPRTVCDVVFQGSSRITGCQFTFTCDGSLARIPRGPSWARAQIVAQDALNGYVEPSVGTATHYHADWVAPWWRNSLTKLSTVGAHIFYRWKGSTGTRGAFTQSYLGGEPEPSTLVAAAALIDPLEDPLLNSTAAVPENAPPPDPLPIGLSGGPPVRAPGADANRNNPAADSHGTLIADEKAGKIER